MLGLPQVPDRPALPPAIGQEFGRGAPPAVPGARRDSGKSGGRPLRYARTPPIRLLGRGLAGVRGQRQPAGWLRPGEKAFTRLHRPTKPDHDYRPLPGARGRVSASAVSTGKAGWSSGRTIRGEPLHCEERWMRTARWSSRHSPRRATGISGWYGSDGPKAASGPSSTPKCELFGDLIWRPNR